MDYFFIAVSNKYNLKLCIDYAYAGFTSNVNGVWTYLDINEGDYISFLYSARAINLYKVERKIAVKNYKEAPPEWKPLKFRNKVYYFPFRLKLKPIRKFSESLIKREFEYIAENLLLRGGYRKTHFQADIITLHNASLLGEPYIRKPKTLIENFEVFEPLFTFDKDKERVPEAFYLSEKILQAITRKYLKDNLAEFFDCITINHNPNEFEVLGEKALPEGHVDILIKEKYPVENVNSILVEIKKEKAGKSTVEQIQRYKESLRYSMLKQVIIAREIAYRKQTPDIIYFTYEFDIEHSDFYTFSDLLRAYKIIKINH